MVGQFYIWNSTNIASEHLWNGSSLLTNHKPPSIMECLVISICIYIHDAYSFLIRLWKIATDQSIPSVHASNLKKYIIINILFVFVFLSSEFTDQMKSVASTTPISFSILEINLYTFFIFNKNWTRYKWQSVSIPVDNCQIILVQESKHSGLLFDTAVQKKQIP